jgi:phage FluMu protein Com
LEELGQLLKAIFETFCTQKVPRCTGMNATHTTFFDSENQTRIFSYTIFPVKKINVGQNFKI